MQSYKKSAFIIFLAIIVLAGFSLFPSKTLADYNTAGFVVSNNLLPAQGASIINSFAYNATSIPAGTQLRVRFSKDGANWYNSAGTYAAWNILSSGVNTIDLSPLGWRTVYFYYEVFFVSDGTATPILKSVTLNFIDSVSVTSNYYTSGSFASTNLLSGQSVASIDSFTYNAIDIPSGTGLSVQFSQDNSTWYDSSGVQNGSDVLSTGNNMIDLSGLGWTSANFYYKISLTSNGTDTPVLKSTSLNFSRFQLPTLSSVSASPSPIKGGNQITITPTGQGTAENLNLYYYCNETGSATSSNTLCSQGNQNYSNAQYSSMTCTYNPTGDASRTVYCRTYDGHGYSAEETATYSVDSTAPSGGSISYTNGYFATASIPITYTVGTDSGSGLDNSTGEIQRASAVLSNGICGTFGLFSNLHSGYGDSPYSDTTVIDGNCYKYQYVISDLVGNQATYTSNNIAKVDVTAPITTATAGTFTSGGWSNTDVTTTLSCGDGSNGSGCASTYYCDDSQNCTDFSLYSSPITVSAEGTSYIQYYSVDMAGNQEQSKTEIINIDKTGPSVSAGSDQSKNAQFTQAGTVTPGISVIVSQTWSKVSGPGNITFGTPNTATTTISADADGAYVIQLTATDTAGNSHSASFNLVWDTALPVLVETIPVPASATNTSPNYTFNSTKAGTISYQGLCLSTTTSAVSGNNTIIFNALAIGTYSNCKITVSDYLGNTSLPLSVSPFTITQPAGGGGAGLMLYQKQNVVSQVVNQITNVTQQITGLFGNNQETPIPQVNYPPIAKAVPEKPQPVFQNNWQVLPVASSPNVSFVNNATPVNIKDLAGKFPQINNTFKALGMGNVIDPKKISNATFILPTLSDAINSKLVNGNTILPGVALNNLPAQAKAVIPTDIVFARTADQKIDYGMNLSVDKSGNVQQKMETVVNKNIELVVKPEKPVASINGYIVLIKTDASPIGKSKYVNYFSASLTGANSSPATPGQNSQGTVVSQFHYDSANGDNIYTSQIETPPVEGTYKIVTVLNYKDPKITAKEIDMTLLVDPEGYVYVRSADGETRIAGAKISIYWQYPKTNGYELWPAKDYSQYNPQVTDVTGKYSFLVPPGNYYMTAEKKGYDFYKTGNFTVQAGSAVNQDILMKKTSFNLWSWFVNLF